MKQPAYFICGFFILLLLGACHGDKSKNQDTSKIDRQGFIFIKNGLVDGLCEIKASGLAITNSNNHRVIDLAKMMITDQAAIDSTFSKLKTERKVSVTDTIDGFDKRFIDTLTKKTGPAFDRAYLVLIAGIHRRDTTLYNWAGKSTDAEISKFAQKTLPAIKQHLDSANAVAASIR